MGTWHNLCPTAQSFYPRWAVCRRGRSRWCSTSWPRDSQHRCHTSPGRGPGSPAAPRGTRQTLLQESGREHHSPEHHSPAVPMGVWLHREPVPCAWLGVAACPCPNSPLASILPPSCPCGMHGEWVCVGCAHPGRRMHTLCIARRGVGMGAAGTCVRGGAGQPTAREAALLVPGAVPVIGAQVGADSITPGSLPWAKAGFGWRGQGAQGTAQSQPGPAALMHCSHSDETANPCLCSMARPAQHKHSPPVAVNLTWLSSQAADAAPLPMATCRLVAAAHPAAHLPGAAQGLCEGRSTVCWGARLTRGTHPLSSSSSPTAPHTCSREQAGAHIPEKAALLSTGAAVVRQAVPPGGARGAAPHCRAHACFAGGRQGGRRPLAPLCPAWWGAGSGGIAAIPTVLLG